METSRATAPRNDITILEAHRKTYYVYSIAWGGRCWNEKVVIMTKFSLYAPPMEVILTTFGAASDKNFIKGSTFPFMCN